MNAKAESVFNHFDILEELNTCIPLNHKLSVIHRAIKMQFEYVDRIAVALYDQPTDLLKTFVHSTSGGEQPLSHYQSKLSDSESLLEIVNQRKPRVVNDLSIFSSGVHTHTKRLAEHGFASSYTLPMFQNSEFFGFVFVNSKQKDAFKSRKSVLFIYFSITNLETLSSSIIIHFIFLSF